MRAAKKGRFGGYEPLPNACSGSPFRVCCALRFPAAKKHSRWQGDLDSDRRLYQHGTSCAIVDPDARSLVETWPWTPYDTAEAHALGGFSYHIVGFA